MKIVYDDEDHSDEQNEPDSFSSSAKVGIDDKDANSESSENHENQPTSEGNLSANLVCTERNDVIINQPPTSSRFEQQSQGRLYHVRHHKRYIVRPLLQQVELL